MSESEGASQSDTFDSSLKRLAAHAGELGEALRAYARDLPFGPAKRNLLQVAADLKRGRIAESLHNDRLPHRELLWSVVADLAQSDSQSALQSTLASIRHYSKRRIRIWRGFGYPAFLIFVCCIFLFFILGFITPRFWELYRDFEIELPPLTMLVLQGQFLLRAIFFALMGFLVMGFLIPATTYDRVLHWLPVIGRYRQCSAVAIFCRSAAALLRSGVSVPLAVEQAGRIPGQPVLEGGARRLAMAMRENASPQVPPYPLVSTVLFALTTDVDTQARSELLYELADVYDERGDKLLSWLEATYEPICAVLLGMFIGCVVIALFLPLVVLVQNLS